jgi:TatD DNase family protein
MNAYENGVKRIINVGADRRSIHTSLELAKKYDFIFNSCGIHPHDAKTYNGKIENELMQITKDPNTVAIGEIGLDYHYDNSPRDVQRQVFARQIDLAGELGFPVIIHDREAHKDCLDILKATKTPSQSGVFHSYSGSAEMVKVIIKMGFYVSFTGVVTFKNARKTIEAARAVPIERLLVETDCPYLSPEPKRGRRNVPDYVRHTAEKLAQIHGKPIDEMNRILWDNTHRLFSRLPNLPYMIK